MIARVPQPVIDRLHATRHAPLFVTVSGAHLYGFDSPDSDDELEHHRPLVNELFRHLEAATEWSTLPEEPDGFAALDDLLIRVRKGLASLVPHSAAEAPA